MNNRLTSALLAASLLLAPTACGAPTAENSTAPLVPPAQAQASQSVEADSSIPVGGVEPQETTASAEPDASGSSILVVWFSRVGVTPFEDGVDASSSASINVRDRPAFD